MGGMKIRVVCIHLYDLFSILKIPLISNDMGIFSFSFQHAFFAFKNKKSFKIGLSK
tara:strand:+ start:516 stop:683 length:168 start_codon:yes stop_codon:yes gene_type:complete